MPILDIKAGSGALANVQNASQNLINTNIQRNQALQNSFLTMANLLHNQAKFQSDEKFRDKQKQLMDSQIENTDADTTNRILNSVGQGIKNQIAEKELNNYDKNQALQEKQVNSQIYANNAKANTLNAEVKQQDEFNKTLKSLMYGGGNNNFSQGLGFFGLLHNKGY